MSTETAGKDWSKVVEFHGHSCPGLAKGYRVAKIALKKLAALRSKDEELVAIVENNACGVDAIQLLAGCSLGKGNLLLKDYGKQVYTFACRNSGEAVRISVKASSRDAAGGRQERVRRILEMPDEELCEISQVNVELPPMARLYDSVICGACGERVMEPRARVTGGRVVCIPCAGHG